MYTEEKQNRSFIKEFALKLILIIIFILLLIWLVPWPNMDALNPLKDQIFNANLQTMKEAGITYFTSERLPGNVGDKTTLTLQKMLDMKLLIPFTDKNGNSCDVSSSFVSLEKQETEYLMKVNLKCGDEEDYILVHLGCYSYCTADICEKLPDSTEKPTTTPNPTKKPPKPSPSPSPSPTPSPTPSPSPSPTPTTDPVVYEYHYKRTHEKQYSEFTPCVEQMKKKGETIVFGQTEFLKIENRGIRKTQIGMTTPVYVSIYEETRKMVKAKTVTYNLCNKYTYVADVTTTYRVDGDWYYTGAKRQGFRNALTIPEPTLSTEWDLVGIDWEQCDNTCTSNPYMIYMEKKRNLIEDNEYSNVTASCTDRVTKSVDIYVSALVGTYKKFEKTPAQPIYGNIQYYCVRTRTLLSDSYNDYQWSPSANDKSLISQGFTYTGNKREKK